ncbi:hypothetical protein OPV22_026165 [Ensete ventricosum]|uniref:Uncharacterized protein n=1 Tax=Ensete ventricosum TaxID=4639 RepID=A0AAV8QHD1_ENSVE|nr:hypothetical protein OPV22_026165 [Ensete ventricosum]
MKSMRGDLSCGIGLGFPSTIIAGKSSSVLGSTHRCMLIATARTVYGLCTDQLTQISTGTQQPRPAASEEEMEMYEASVGGGELLFW